MEIGSPGAHYLDESRFSSPLIDAQRRREAEGGGGFSALLEKAVGTAGEAPGSGSKPVIDKTDKLYEQCEALETFLVKNLITGMRNTVPKSEFLSGGFAGKMYEDMLYDEYAEDFTKSAGFGLAELAYLELTHQRGVKR